MTKQITIPDLYRIPLEKDFDGETFIPREVGSLKLLRQESLGKIVYYDWDLSFVDRTFASKPDNFGRDEIQVIFNLSQSIEWQVDKGRELVRMKPGEVCIFRNNDYQTSMSYAGAVSFQFKSLQMETSYFSWLLSRYFPKEKIELCKSLFLTHVTKTAITADMYRTLAEIDSADKYQDFKGVFIEGKMIELIALVLHGIFYNANEMYPRSPDREKTQVPPFTKKDTGQIESLRQRIQFAPEKEYSAREIAKSLAMSESKLTRTFRTLYGVSLHRYVQDKRLEKAASLLSQGGVNISEAALKSGYTNMSWFSSEFQKKFGMSPKKFAMQCSAILPENC